MKVFRLLAICLMAAVVSAPLFGQGASATYGNIYGKVSDESGGALPGVSVTLTGGGGARTATSGGQGEFRFLNLAPGSYTVKTELNGFSTVERTNVTVSLGSNTEVAIPMKIASVATTVTVSSETPLLDTRKVSTGSDFTSDQLKSIPTARDPWVVLQQVPSVQIDRVNVAGSESGQQSAYIGKGVDSTQNSWLVDGVEVTDMSAQGSSSTYYDFDAFQEMQATTGGSDPAVAVPGVTLNMVTKRGTNEVHGSARIFETPSGTEARANSNAVGPYNAALGGPTELKVGSGNSIDHIQDYGAEAGGPIVADKAWLWGSYGRDQIDLTKLSSAAKDLTTLENYSGKLNIQPIESNSATAFYFRGDKIKLGRTGGNNRGQGTAWDQTGPTTIWKADDSQVFGPNFVVNAALDYVRAGFTLAPQGGLGPNMIQDQNEVWQGTFFQFGTYRPQHQATANASYFFNTGSIGHELKFGFGYKHIIGGSSTTWPGNQDVNYLNYNGSGQSYVKLFRNLVTNATQTYYDAYVGDTMTANNLTVNVGIRYDDQKGFNAPSSAPGNNSVCDPGQPFSISNPCIPALNYGGAAAEVHFKDWEPRVGLTYALGAQKSTLLRASYARFADSMGTTYIAYDNPVAYTYMLYPFTDANHNGLADPGELGPNAGFEGLNPNNPNSLLSPNKIQPNLKDSKTDEFMIGVDHQILPELVAGLSYTHRHRSDSINGHLVGVTAADFQLDPSRSNLPAYDQQGHLIGNTGNYYDFIAPAGFTGGEELVNDPGFTTNYNGVEMQLTKRLSNRWMAHASAAYTDWRTSNKGGDSCLASSAGLGAWKGPTNVLTTTLGASCADNVQAFESSQGSGSKADVNLSSKWQFNVSGLYQLPLNFNVAANLFARQGYLQVYYASITGGDVGTSLGSRKVIVGSSDDHRLNNLYQLDLRVEKILPLFQKADMTLSVDMFNALNSNTVLQQSQQLSTNACGGTVSCTGKGNRVEETMSPRVLRFGARLSF